MRVENILIRSRGEREVDVSWISETAETVSFVLINGQFYWGQYRPETTERNAVLPIPSDKTYIVEVFDFSPEETASKDFLLQSLEEPIRTSPEIEWNPAENAAEYQIDHALVDQFDLDLTPLTAVPALTLERCKIGCPKPLEGRNGRWHIFRIKSVDMYKNESEGEWTAYFASDLPAIPQLTLSQNTETSLFSFTII